MFLVHHKPGTPRALSVSCSFVMFFLLILRIQDFVIKYLLFHRELGLCPQNKVLFYTLKTEYLKKWKIQIIGNPKTKNLLNPKDNSMLLKQNLIVKVSTDWSSFNLTRYSENQQRVWRGSDSWIRTPWFALYGRTVHHAPAVPPETK